MSQHHFSTTRMGTSVHVLLGWDRPLSRHFMVVETAAQQQGRDEERYLYSNLTDPEAALHDPDLDYFRGKLVDLGIKVPDSLFVEVARDAAQNVGNRVVHHAADGTIAERVPANAGARL